MIITIDGYAGSGKSSVARALAAALRFDLMNTGAMYRAAAYDLQRIGIRLDASPRDIAAITTRVQTYHFRMSTNRVWLNHEDVTDEIFTEELGQWASKVGTFPEVREHLKQEQRRLADDRDIICEGRDQGTAVFPKAEVKFFLKASVEIRAKRRAMQEKVDLDHDPAALTRYCTSIRERDKQDEERAIDPLRKADDAIEFDTSYQSVDDIILQMVKIVDQCRNLH